MNASGGHAVRIAPWHGLLGWLGPLGLEALRLRVRLFRQSAIDGKGSEREAAPELLEVRGSSEWGRYAASGGRNRTLE